MDSKKIFIDTDTEISFILQDILNSENDRVCLVVPDRASIFNSIATLKLMKRVIDKSSKLLVLVTLDTFGARLAEKVGIKTLSRIGELNESIWEEVQKNKFEVIKHKHKNANNSINPNNNINIGFNINDNLNWQNNKQLGDGNLEIDLLNEPHKIFVNLDLNDIDINANNNSEDVNLQDEENLNNEKSFITNSQDEQNNLSFELQDSIDTKSEDQKVYESNTSTGITTKIRFFKGLDVLLENEKNINKTKKIKTE